MLHGVMDLHEEVVWWGRHGSSSKLEFLDSGHCAVDISEHIERFSDIVPGAEQFCRAEKGTTRTRWWRRMVMDMNVVMVDMM
eukprot:4228395-Prorocentrum_lima.AAC.1